MNDQASPLQTEATAPQSAPITPKPALRNPKTKRLRSGKIARLPLELRDGVSRMLYEGRTHDSIARELREDGDPDITRQNIGSWARGGYHDWLKTHEIMESASLKADLHLTFPYTTHQDALKLNNVNNFLLAARMNQVLEHLDPKELARLIASDPELFFRFIKEEFSRQQQERELDYKVEDRKHSIRQRGQIDAQMRFLMLPESERLAELEKLKQELKAREQKLLSGGDDSTPEVKP